MSIVLSQMMIVTLFTIIPIVQGASSNGDAFINGSTYLYKKRGGKLCWGPLWDFDYVAWWATDFESNDMYESYRLDFFP